MIFTKLHIRKTLLTLIIINVNGSNLLYANPPSPDLTSVTTPESSACHSSHLAVSLDAVFLEMVESIRNQVNEMSLPQEDTKIETIRTKNSLSNSISVDPQLCIKQGGQCAGLSYAVGLGYLYAERAGKAKNFREAIVSIARKYSEGADLPAAIFQGNQSKFDDVLKTTPIQTYNANQWVEDQQSFTDLVSTLPNGVFQLSSTGAKENEIQRSGHAMLLLKQDDQVAFFDPNVGVIFYNESSRASNPRTKLIDNHILTYFGHQTGSQFLNSYLNLSPNEAEYRKIAKTIAKSYMAEKQRNLYTSEAFSIYHAIKDRFPDEVPNSFREEFVTSLTIQPGLFKTQNMKQTFSIEQIKLKN